MASCDKCWQGRHVRCGGRDGCSCTVCTPSLRKNRRRTEHTPQQVYRHKYVKVKPSTLPLPSVTVDEVLTAIRVLEDLPNLMDHARFASQKSFERLGIELQVSSSTFRKLIAGTAPQGMSTKSLASILPWIAEQLPRVSRIAS